METAPIKTTTAVPLEVQRVLDEMTPQNWVRCGNKIHGRMCLMNRAAAMGCDAFSWRDQIWGPLKVKISERYGKHVTIGYLNDSAKSLADLKSKIIALYTEGV